MFQESPSFSLLYMSLSICKQANKRRFLVVQRAGYKLRHNAFEKSYAEISFVVWVPKRRK
jgi:hypothetical protein